MSNFEILPTAISDAQAMEQKQQPLVIQQELEQWIISFYVTSILKEK